MDARKRICIDCSGFFVKFPSISADIYIRMTEVTLTRQIPLSCAFKKSNVRMKLSSRTANPQEIETSLPPVLFHGTAKIQLQMWEQLNGISYALSLSGKCCQSVLYASYSLSSINYGGDGKTVVSVELFNGQSRRIPVILDMVQSCNLLKEFEELARGQVIQSLVLFETSSVLESTADNNIFSRFDDEGNGLRVEVDKKAREYARIPFSAIFASLDVNIETRQAVWHIYDREAWDRNFTVEPPNLDAFKAIRYQGNLYIYFLVKAIFENT